jgi:chromosome segregation ATPase
VAERNALTARAHEVKAVKVAVADWEERAASLDQALTARTQEVDALKVVVTDREERAAELDQALATNVSAIVELRDALTDRELQINLLRSTISAIYASTSWRITSLLRSLKKMVTRL